MLLAFYEIQLICPQNPKEMPEILELIKKNIALRLKRNTIKIHENIVKITRGELRYIKATIYPLLARLPDNIICDTHSPLEQPQLRDTPRKIFNNLTSIEVNFIHEGISWKAILRNDRGGGLIKDYGNENQWIPLLNANAAEVLEEMENNGMDTIITEIMNSL